jgi:drug/metabolite transporter (DMT)-like permease
VRLGMRWKIVLAFAAVYLCWGMTYLAMRIAVRDIPPHLMSGARFLVAGLLLYLWTRRRGETAPSAAQWRAAALIGAFLLLGGNATVAWAEQQVPSGLAAVLIAVAPIWMVGFEWLRGGPRPGARVVAGLLLGLAGVALLVSPNGEAATQVNLTGAMLLVLASASWAWGSVISKQAALPKSPFLATSMEMLAGGSLLLLTAAAAGQFAQFRPAQVSTEAVLAWLFLVVFGSLVGFTAYIWLLGVTSIAKAGTYAYVNPVVAVFLGWAVLDEPVTGRTVVAALVILLGVGLVNIEWRTRITSPSDLSLRRARGCPGDC